MDKIIARLADENTDLKGVIDIAHFNDEKKLGSGKEMVDKLTGLISIFQRPELNFSRNKAEGDDIIGDAYEYLMRKFATESGKSKAIKSGNTFSNPQYLDKSDNSILERFDYIVANPLFSMKNWRDGIAGKEYGRFEGYGDTPLEKNGVYAWLMHILKALKFLASI